MRFGYPVKRRVIVNTKSGKAFRGILWKETLDFIVLKQAELLRSGSEVVGMDGEIVIYKTDIDFMQVLS